MAMERDRPSISAQQVALARAHLTWRGVLEDNWATSMLRSPWRELERLLRLPPLSRAGRGAGFGYLAARTRFYDQGVRAALKAGIDQVVIVGAGYDSRAWRLASSGVRFFEIDHPATQSDKRRRAPHGGPVYVAVDLERDELPTALAAAGHHVDHATVFVVEGLLMYLSEERVRALLHALSARSGPGSRLVTNFGIGSDDRHHGLRGAVRRALIKQRGEPFKFRLPGHEAERLLAQSGWTITDSLNGPELAAQQLTGTGLADDSLNRDGLLFLVAETQPHSSS
jgi:methyltransferase (TIGR00027 family)